MPMRRAMFPTLARLTGAPASFAIAVLGTFSTIATVCLATGFGLMSVAPELVQLLLGDKWHSAIPIVQWLALFGGFSALVLVLEVPLWVSGRTHFSAAQTWLELAILVPSVWWATKAFGIEGAAAVRTVVSSSMVPVMMYLTARAGHVSGKQLLSALLRPLAAGIAMAVALAALPFGAISSLALVLVLKIALGALIYAAVMFALWLVQGRPQGFEAQALSQTKRVLARTLAPSLKQ
jgi:O-antigen/teichoic acid export membrane protein